MDSSARTQAASAAAYGEPVNLIGNGELPGCGFFPDASDGCMQLPGKLCTVCRDKIFLQTEGTWCGSCEAAFHSGCWKEGTQCPECGAPLEAPGRQFVRSAKCPECGTPSRPESDACPKCGVSVCWDNQAKYQERKDRVRSYGRTQVFLGVLEFTASLIFLLALFGIISVGLAFLAMPDAVLRFRRGRRAMAFE